jgi:acetoacetate decarboxylase
MRIDQTGIHVTPFIMGPVFDRKNLPGLVHAEVELLILDYLTERDVVRQLLPDCYELGEDPTVNISFAEYGGVDFLAGNGYRHAAVQVAARYDGQEDHLDGEYVLVAFENETMPIIMGREHLGIPKVYGDISPIKALSNGHLRCEASLWGHLLFGIEAACPSRQTASACKEAGKSLSERPTFGYKFFQSLDGPLDADYPTVSWADFEIEEMWVGTKARLYLGSPSEEDIGEFRSIIDALRPLPAREVTHTIHARGSMVLRYDKCRRLG